MDKFYNKKYFIIEDPDFYIKNPRRISLNRVAKELVDSAFGETIVGYSNDKRIRDAIREGKEIPEHCKPGRAIMRYSKEKRELIKKLKEKHFNSRWL